MALLKIKNDRHQFVPVEVLSVDAIAFGGFSYSIEEQVIGCWQDGRPLYRTIKKIAANDLSQFTLATGLKWYHGISNIKDVLPPRAFMESQLTLPWLDISTGRYVGIFATNEAVLIRGNGGDNVIKSGADMFVILEYTKTTDAENSFTTDMLTVEPIDAYATDSDVEEVLA